MTVLDSFVAFARALPADRRDAIDETLAALMESFADQHDFTPDELSELRRRSSETDPVFANLHDIESIFGKPFRS
ncbi:MAG: hypothetical protein ABIU10_01165 [Sphingomicrobium sp.]